jgi:plastocyanin
VSEVVRTGRQGIGRVERTARLVAAVVVLAILVAACGGGDDDGGNGSQGYQEPKGPAEETIDVGAGNFYFDPDDITTAPGIAEISMVGEGGIHTFVFDDGAYPGFKLEVSGSETAAGKIDLASGSYTFYCDIPGHRQQGMAGTLTVS